MLYYYQRIAALTSYRSVEVVDWFGFSQLRSLTVGLCGNHKPNRFYKSKENAYKSLASAGLLFFR